MKRFIRSILLALVIAAPVPVLAQNNGMGGEAPRSPEGMNDMNGMNGANGMNGMADGGVMPMMNMMMACANMMEGMHDGAMAEGAGNDKGFGSAMPGMMSQAESASYDTATAEALARAYLSGRDPESAQDIEIVGTSLDAGRYTVTYRQGDTEGRVTIDAATGIVVPEEQP